MNRQAPDLEEERRERRRLHVALLAILIAYLNTAALVVLGLHGHPSIWYWPQATLSLAAPILYARWLRSLR